MKPLIELPGAALFSVVAALLLLLFAVVHAAETEDEDPPQAESAVLNSPELMSHYLAAEIAVHDGDLERAFEHFMQILSLANEASIARRATHIGLHLKSGRVLDAAKMWVQLSPDDLEAWKALLVLQVNADDREGALQATQSLMGLAAAQQSDGFLLVAAVVAESGNKEIGLELVKELAQRHGDDPRAHYALAIAYFGQKDEAAAETSLRTALELKKDDLKIWVLLARILDAQQRSEESEKLLQQGLVHLPDNDLLRLSYAEHLVIHEKFDQAYREFKLLHKSLPENDEITQALGSLAIELELWSDAREIWNEMREKHGKKERALYFLGQIEEGSGNSEKALDYYNQVGGKLRTDARIRSAQLLARQGDLQQALKVIATARLLSMEDAVRLYLVESDLLAEANKWMQAMGLLDRALAEHPQQVDLLYARGMLGDDMGSLEILERDMHAIIKIDAENAQALNALGYTLTAYPERLEEAYTLIKQAYTLMPESAAILDSMGWVEFRMGNYAEAEKFLRQAAAKDKDSEIMAHLGEVLWVRGHHDEAAKIWQEALSREPESEHVLSTMKRLQPQDEQQVE
ncbi:MAG: tetratricopeptide repeat protein [Pseudomonadota bacterium]